MSELRLHPNHLPELKKIAYAMRDQAKHESENPPFSFGRATSVFNIKKAEALSLTAKAFGFKDWGTMQHVVSQNTKYSYHPQFIPSSGGHSTALRDEFGVRDYLFTYLLLKDYTYEDAVSKAYEEKLAAMETNQNASESTDAFYSYPAEEGVLLDLVILSGGAGYGIALDETGSRLENEVTIIAPRFINEGRVLDSTDYDDPSSQGEKAQDLLSQIQNTTNDPADKPVFGGMKIYSEMEGPFFHTCPLFILDSLPEKEEDFIGPQRWRDEVRKFHQQGNVPQLYYLPTPIDVEGDIIHFVEKAEGDDALILFSDSLYMLPVGFELPSDAVALNDIDRIYLSMAMREWSEDVVAQKWAQGSLKKDIVKYRNNQQICHALDL